MARIVLKGIVLMASHFGRVRFHNRVNTTHVPSVGMRGPSFKEKWHLFWHFYYFFERTRTWSNISNTRKSVSSGYPNPEKSVGWKNEAQPSFLTDFEVFGYLMKHSFEFLIWLLKPFIILGEIESKRLQNFMPIKFRYPNHRHGSSFVFSLWIINKFENRV